MAATAARNTNKRPNVIRQYPIAATTIVYMGTLGALNAAGNLVSATDAAALRVVGMISATVDNSVGAAGDLSAPVERGCFHFANSAANAVDADDKDKLCYVEDNETVAETSVQKIVAGRVVDVDNEGVWVEVGFNFPRVAPTLTSTDGVAAAAADLAALKAEAEKIGDDVRALHAAIYG